ncbi:CaiB/BaiF CoA-transferase family protein [Acrocarpospora macrocephala]|uniref:CoA transferase n=1 Tax=Acrocarpospora macrocephala TaxID=150177 RepID=A0A5M3WPC2_9ACTN|nr:CaiB/BaiF CoA-transferase family protein [Acrocarpospora macrocephala]GES11175.1 CoA transferase [Acrocarpospora macrocephala]
MNGPLAGLRVVEIGSIGPGPFCAMMLADMGAEVIRVDRLDGGGPVGPSSDHAHELMNRGRRSAGVNLKHPRGPGVVLRLVEQADVLIEGFRPRVAERLGIGPEVCLARNPRLVYGRMTGYGQEGPGADTVGHDLNYIAANGVLSMIGRRGQPPTPPLNLVGDIGGGGLILAFGLLAALFERTESGRGQVVDAAMVDGAAVLATQFFGWVQTGEWSPDRGTNMIDSGAPYYDVYETADGRWLSVAAVEPRFYAALLKLFELDAADLPDRDDPATWPVLKETFAATVRSRTRAEWCTLAVGLDACVAPVLGPEEVEADEHLSARGTFVRADGVLQPAPAPRFSRTPARLTRPPARPGEHTAEALADWGFSAADVADLQADKVIGRGRDQ